LDHGLHVASRLVDLAVDEALAVQAGRVGRDRLAIEANLDDVGAGDECRRHGARYEKMIGIFRRPRGDMAEAVQNPLVSEDMTCRDDVLNSCLVRVALGIALSVTRRSE
jgi:hypothetical protein